MSAQQEFARAMGAAEDAMVVAKLRAVAEILAKSISDAENAGWGSAIQTLRDAHSDIVAVADLVS